MCILDDSYNMRLSGLCCKCKKKKSTPPHSCEVYPQKNGIPPKVWRGDIKECGYYESRYAEGANT